ncbi:MAG: hypothetical protein AB1430_16735 [Pseudomonadota bacterium]
MAASLLAHGLVFALVMQASRPVPPRQAVPSRPAMLWLNVAAASAAAVAPVQAPVQPRATPKRRLAAAAPVPVTAPASAPRALAQAPAAPGSAPVRGVVFAPLRIAFGGGATRRWVQPPLPAEPAASVSAAEHQAELARAAHEAHRRQMMAALQRQAADPPLP